VNLSRSLFAVLALGALGPFASAQGTVENGDTPQYIFRDPLLNGRGVTSLADLRGKPVLVEFWGTR